VGGPGDNSNTGAAWVYTLSGVWTQQGKLAANDAVGSAAQGWSVALDGNSYAIVGGPGDNSNTGAAWVYTLSGGFWTQQGSKLVANDAVGQARQGWSVVVRSNTPKAIVGGPGDNSNAGAAWVYHNYQNAGVWTQLGSKLVGTGAVGEAQQGSSVQLSNDEDTALVGGSADNSGAGAIWLYQCAAPPNCGGLLTQQGSKLVGTGAVGKAQQGFLHRVVRRRQHRHQPGRARADRRRPRTWAHQAVARPGEGRRGGFRTVVAYRVGERAVFMFGFAKSDQANLSPAGLRLSSSYPAGPVTGCVNRRIDGEACAGEDKGRSRPLDLFNGMAIQGDGLPVASSV
jgi:hypothetical protein